MRLLFKLLMRIGLISSGPAVSSITSSTQIEGTSLVHTVTLASAVAVTEGLYPFSIGGGTATSGTDYTATPTFSAGVTRSGGTLTVPVGVSSFTITVSTTNDTVYEGTETYTVSVGSMSNTGTLTDNDSAPTVTGVSSASATEASSIVHTVTVTGTAQAAQTYAISLSGGTATGGGTDYTSTLTNGAFSAGVTISGGNISVPSGVTSFTVTVPTTSDVLEEGNETYTLTIGGASGTGTIVDDDAPSPAFIATLTALSNASGVVTTLAYINGGGGGSSLITPAFTANRYSGTAPLGVMFDASGTTAAALTSLPYHELHYRIECSDGNTATWGYGTGAGTRLKNVMFGATAGYVFETPGTHTCTLTVTDPLTGDQNTDSFTVTVNDPDTVYSGTNTIVISTGTDFTGKPTGATEVTTSSWATIVSYMTTGKRVLLKRGDVWTTAATAIMPSGSTGGTLGAWGSGALPKITATASNIYILQPNGASDWRYMDIEADGASLGTNSAAVRFISASDGNNTFATFLRLYSHHCGNHGSPQDDGIVFDCRYNNTTGEGGNVGIYTSKVNRMAILGTEVSDATAAEHNIRLQGVRHAVVSNCKLNDPNLNFGKQALTVRGWSTGTTWDGIYTQYVIASDNVITSTGDTQLTEFARQSSGHDERLRDIIFERNYVKAPAAYLMSTNVQFDFTIRNNLYDTTGGSGGGVISLSSDSLTTTPGGQSTFIYNNTFYHGSSGNPVFISIAAYNNGVASPPTGTVIRNNLAYAPSATTPRMYYNYATGSVDAPAGTNSSDAQILGTAPGFTIPPTSTLTTWKPTSGYAINGGVSRAVYDDFFSVQRTGTMDFGAVLP